MRHDDRYRLSTAYHHTLCAERLNDFGSQTHADVRYEFGDAVGECFLLFMG